MSIKDGPSPLSDPTDSGSRMSTESKKKKKLGGEEVKNPRFFVKALSNWVSFGDLGGKKTSEIKEATLFLQENSPTAFSLIFFKEINFYKSLKDIEKGIKFHAQNRTLSIMRVTAARSKPWGKRITLHSRKNHASSAFTFMRIHALLIISFPEG